MKFFIQLNLLLDWNVLFALAGWRDIPRRILKDRSSLTYSTYQNHTVFFHPEDSDELYVGGTGFVLRVDVANNRIIEEFPLNATGEQTCAEGPCENVITVLQKFQDSLMVCASNGQKPRCWKLYSQVDNGTRGIVDSFDGTGISPYSYTQNSLSLTVEGDLYTAVSLDHSGKSLQFRRKSGGRPSVWMYGTWLSEPTFISASWVKRTDDPQNEKIYIFFREKNSDRSPEADRWISRVARVCKVDEGGSKRFFQNIWTSFLKARLVCGIPKESLYFNRLQEVYVVHAEDWRQSRVYGLFTSSWNSTAVCIYSMEEIDTIFENSTFKGFDKEIPNPRPGQCVPDSKRLPLATVNVIKDHPEMSDWIHSIHHHAPFYISSHNYTKIAVDQVLAADGHMHNVLLLATDSGTIHKVLEDGSEPFIISETQLFNHSAVIRAMTLESRKKRLVVGFSEQISILDLQRCQDYNASCAECVLARDPYCAWSRSGCSPTAPGSIQNIPRGQINVCHESTEVSPDPNESPQRARRETVSPSPAPPPTVRAVPLDVPLYLSCPIDSYHAVYTWEHGGQSIPCLHTQSACLHLIPAVAQGSYGGYACVSTEKDYTRTVTAYQVQPELDRMCRSTPDGSSSVPDGRSGVSAVIAHGEWLVGLAAVAVVSLLL